MNRVASIYDALAGYEVRHRRPPYPVHKNLKLDNGLDLIHWISEKVDFGRHDDILDAGCGNGHSLVHLAKTHGCRGTGISLSQMEIDMARLVSGSSSDSDVSFNVMNFDEITGSFSKILAIESLRHSPNIQNTFHHLTKLLRPGGQLIIADDFVISEDRDARQHRKYWDSPSFLPVQEYVDIVEGVGHLQVASYDLTSSVPVRAKRSLDTKVRLLKLARVLGLGNLKRNLTTYLGAVLLERMYVCKQAEYRLLVITKTTGNDSKKDRPG